MGSTRLVQGIIDVAYRCRP